MCLQVFTKVKSLLEALELELQVVVNHPIWVQGPKLQSFGRAASILNH